MDLQDIKTPGLSCDLHDNPDIKERELALSHKILMSVKKSCLIHSANILTNAVTWNLIFSAMTCIVIIL